MVMISKYQIILLFIANLVLLFSGTYKQGEAYESFLKGEYEILQNNLNSNFPAGIKTIFNINNETVNGTIEEIERKIIDFFRRRGIHFYEE